MFFQYSWCMQKQTDQRDNWDWKVKPNIMPTLRMLGKRWVHSAMQCNAKGLPIQSQHKLFRYTHCTEKVTEGKIARSGTFHLAVCRNRGDKVRLHFIQSLISLNFTISSMRPQGLSKMLFSPTSMFWWQIKPLLYLLILPFISSVLIDCVSRLFLFYMLYFISHTSHRKEKEDSAWWCLDPINASPPCLSPLLINHLFIWTFYFHLQESH